jgi:5-hydroxyisourate hydrolase
MSLSSHVLDTTRGRPARGVPLVLEVERAGVWTEVARAVTDEDGRVRFPDASTSGVHRVTFDTGAYFRGLGLAAFYPHVPVVFTIDDPGQHYHVPLLLSPYGYATYRGS